MTSNLNVILAYAKSTLAHTYVSYANIWIFNMWLCISNIPCAFMANSRIQHASLLHRHLRMPLLTNWALIVHSLWCENMDDNGDSLNNFDNSEVQSAASCHHFAAYVVSIEETNVSSPTDTLNLSMIALHFLYRLNL